MTRSIDTAAVLACAVGLVLAMLLGTVTTLYVQQSTEQSRLEAELASTKASARQARQKLYDMQEADEKAESEEMGKLRVQLWEAQQKAEKCKP